MSLTKRTKKRFTILCAILLVFAGGVAVAYVVREGQLDRKALASLDDGLAAYEQGEYETALHKIGTYLQRHGEDAEADTLYAYADCRLNVPVPNDRHITQGIALMERVLDEDPGHADAMTALLELRLRVGQTLEAIALADSILSRDPAHRHAHATKVWANQLAGDIDAAIEAARAQHEQFPEDVEVTRGLIGLMLQVPAYRRELVGSGNEDGLLLQLRQQHAEDPAYLLMLAQAYRALEDADAGQACLQAAIDLGTADEGTARRIGLEMMRSEAFGFEAAFEYIGNVLGEREDADALQVWLAQQRFFMGEIESARQLAEEIESESEAYVAAQALLTLLAGERKGLDAVRQHTDIIRQQGTTVAEAWVSVFDATLLADNPKAADVRPVLLEAIEADPENRYFHFALAVAYRDLGEHELAAQRLTPIVQAEPAWWGAGLELVGLLESIGNFSAAYQVLQSVYRLHPEVAAVRVRWAVLASLALSPSDPVAAGELYKELSSFSEATIAEHPDSADAILLSQARCLSILNRDGPLRETLLRILEGTDSPAVVGVCAQIARRQGLDLDTQLAEKTLDALMSDAIMQAEVLVAQGETDRALALLDTAIAESDLEEDARLLVRLRFMDRHQTAGVLDAWRDILERFPDNPGLLRDAADSSAVLANEDLAPKVIEQLKAMTGDEGLAWRFAEVRHQAILAKTDRERIEVADRLGAMVRDGYAKTPARLLLAEIFLALDNSRGAFNQLSLAVEENPYDARANLAMVQLAVREERYAVATTALGRLVLIENLSPAIAAEVARVADGLGERSVAQAMRSRPEVGPYLKGPERLAQLRSALMMGDEATAKALQAELLESEDPQVLRGLAVLLVLHGGDIAAAVAVDALAECENSTPAILAMTRASVAELAGQPEDAFAILQAASNTDAGDDRALQTQYIRLLLAQADGLASAAEYLRGRGDNGLADADQAALFCFERALALDEPRRGLLQALGLEVLAAEQPGVFRRAAETLLGPGWTPQEGPGPRLFERLASLRESHPNTVSLYNLATTLYLMSGQPGQAITLARQTRERFENDPVSARLLAQAYAQTNQWNLVLGATQVWARLAPPTRENQQAIDLLTASALIETGDPNAALNSLAGYGSDQAIALTARSLIRANRVSDAEEILFPKLRTDSPRWRVTLMQLALTEVLEINERAAGRWLDEVEPLVPVDAIPEKLLWAQAMFVVGQRLDSDTRQGRAHTLMRSMQEDEAFPPSGWLLIGVYHEARGELQPAEEAYQKALAMDPGQHQAANNLANILLAQGLADEARGLSERAVALTQANPRASYLDTLAQIERGSGNTQHALELWGQAIQADRENPKWYLMLAELQLELGELDQARDTLRRMRQWADPIATDDAENRARLERLEQAL